MMGASSLKLLPVLLSAATAVSVTVTSCGDGKKEAAAAIDDSELFPTMLTTDVSTFISDSGYTRYHVTAPLWMMYEEADTPFWTFPEGMDLEKFDDDMNAEATFRADSATYYSTRKLWRFDGNVNMRNVDGDRFATPQLFWDQNAKRVYSDSFMHIERSERIIEGYGFESNDQMTEYTVLHPQMILPIDRMRAERNEAARNEAARNDSAQRDTAVATAAASAVDRPATPSTSRTDRRRPAPDNTQASLRVKHRFDSTRHIDTSRQSVEKLKNGNIN